MHPFDRLLAVLASNPQFFLDGWGDRALTRDTDVRKLSRRRPRLRVTLGEPRRAHGGWLREGWFESPERALPDCARIVGIRLLLPRGPTRGVALHLAASGDQTYALRLRFAAPMLRHGIGALVVEHPFYGTRRPHTQPRYALRSVSDFHLMGRAAMLEALGLLRWLDEELGVPRLGVTGYSMGGQLAAMVGAAWPGPLAVVPLAPSCSPEGALTCGVFRGVPRWEALSRGGDREAARRELLTQLSRLAVTRLPRPRCPAAAIVVGTRHDGVVPPGDMERIARHWSAELRWLPAGHVTAVLLHAKAMREAVLEAFRRLEAGEAVRGRRARRGRLAPAA